MLTLISVSQVCLCAKVQVGYEVALAGSLREAACPLGDGKGCAQNSCACLAPGSNCCHGNQKFKATLPPVLLSSQAESCNFCSFLCRNSSHMGTSLAMPLTVELLGSG